MSQTQKADLQQILPTSQKSLRQKAKTRKYTEGNGQTTKYSTWNYFQIIF
jgi:hypothetical protein